jgi:hypothetical protein
MAFFERTKLRDVDGNTINPATEESLSLLKRILILLKPLGNITGGGSNRLNIDVNSITNGVPIAAAQTLANVTTVATVTTVTTVGTVTNQAQIGGIVAFEQLKSINRIGYANSIRANITFS